MRPHALLKRGVGTVRTATELAAIALTVWFIGLRAHAFTGTSKGYDASGHLSKARFILDNWPHISWNYEWYSGQPSFAGSYPPGYHVLLAAIAELGRVSLSTSMNLVSYGSVVLVVVGLYATVRAATGSRLGGLVAAGFFVGTPTLWAQVVVLGLYPRFAALALMSLALAAAVAHANRGGRWRFALASVLLALCLSFHPIVGMIGVGLVAGNYLLDPRKPVGRRALTAATVLAGAFALTSYFYLPLALSSRSQSLFTDSEVSLSWTMLFRHAAGHLDGLTPWLVPLGVGLVVVAILASLAPAVPYEEKVALGTDVVLLAGLDEPDPSAAPGGTALGADRDPTQDLPAAAGPGTRRYVRWHRRVQSVGHPLRLAVLFALASAGVFGYGLVGLVAPHFPFYVNGLQPADLLVYPAFLLSGVIGLVVFSLLPGVVAWISRRLRRPVLVPRLVMTAAVLVAAASAVLPSVRDTRAALPAAEWTNADVATHSSVLPAQTATDRQHRFAGAADVTSEWVNEYSGVSQVRGYDDHGALHLDWQAWLEGSLLHASAPPAERQFLLDWYAVKWVDADRGVGELSQYDSAPQTFTPLTHFTAPYVRIQTYTYNKASPILSASNAPTVLVVGDLNHYDLFLRALALSGVDSSALIPLEGPASLDDVTPALLRSVDGVALYGAQVGRPIADSAALSAFVRAGGGLFADPTESNLNGLAGAPDSPLGVLAARETVVQDNGWSWRSYGDPTVRPADLPAFGPPSYAGSGAWSTQTATRLAAWAHPILATHGATVAAAGQLGSGHVVWEGLNLPYHLDVYRSAPEADWLGRLLLSTVHPPRAVPTVSSAAMVNGEDWRLRTAGARGVLFKEQDAPGWQATVNGHPAPLYPAGPGMMWLPVPTAAPVSVELRYRLSALEKLGYAASVATVVVFAVLLLSGWARRHVHRRGWTVVDGSVARVPLQRKGSTRTTWEPLPLDFGR